MPGGFNNAKEATEEVQTLAKGMKEQVEKQLGQTFDRFDAVVFSTQVVAGTNYLIKVQVGEEKFVHIKVHVPLAFKNAPNELLECEGGKTFLDPLVKN